MLAPLYGLEQARSKQRFRQKIRRQSWGRCHWMVRL